jgi:phosphoribosylanthranilate isomerase
MKRTRIKICGITNRIDAEIAIEAGVDALGFNLFPGSKRFINLKSEVSWIRSLSPFVTRVAVMVNPSPDELENVLREPAIDQIQFHGSESPEFLSLYAERGIPFLKAIAASHDGALGNVERFRASGILLDAYVSGQFGGTGRLVDLGLAARFVAANPEVPVILSGGLNPSNVAEAILRVKPFAVDVATGVEATGNPRKKDASLVRRFVSEALRDPG